MTVIITVPLFVFYNIAIAMGGMSNQVFLASLKEIGIECVFAFLLQVLLAGKLAPKIAFNVINPANEKEYITMIAIVCSTVVIMCPTMSFIANIMYNGFTSEFIAQWMQKIVFNFPFAIFIQLFLVQPLVKYVFESIFDDKKEETVGALANNSK